MDVEVLFGVIGDNCSDVSEIFPNSLRYGVVEKVVRQSGGGLEKV